MINFHLVLKNGVTIKTFDGKTQKIGFQEVEDNSREMKIISTWYDKNGYYMAGSSWDEIWSKDRIEQELDSLIELNEEYKKENETENRGCQIFVNED